MTHRVLLDAEELVTRRHTVAVIATAMSAPGSAWPGEGARVDVGRIVAARRIAFARWCARTGEINERGAREQDDA